MCPDRNGDRARRSREQDKDPGAEYRDLAAEYRDQLSQDRDKASESRDRAADVRDLRAQGQDLQAESRDQADSAHQARAAAADRVGARLDRWAGAEDRSHAEGDRAAASRDRSCSARDRTASAVDGLTGAHRREAGMVELAREAARARRTHQPFVVALVDVDRLKATNDSLGHAAGDQLLARIVETMRAHLRPYDLITRVGGDKFLCSLMDLTTAQAADRFSVINADLAASTHASITAGIAQLNDDESLDDLIANADAALRAQRLRWPTAQA